MDSEFDREKANQRVMDSTAVIRELCERDERIPRGHPNDARIHQKAKKVADVNDEVLIELERPQSRVTGALKQAVGPFNIRSQQLNGPISEWQRIRSLNEARYAQRQKIAAG